MNVMPIYVREVTREWERRFSEFATPDQAAQCDECKACDDDG